MPLPSASTQRTASLPSISIIVPARDAEAPLAFTLPAIRERCTPDGDWELIVVDDGSRDGTAELAARFADRVVRLDGPAGGPARARNAGAAVARGEWLLFIDADVRLHSDTLDLLVRTIGEHPGAVGIFGSYDAAPAGPGVVSQFRNLLHHYVHIRSPGPAETFWAGLGAMRRDAFLAAGGFDAARYRRPQIEDIELGYRVRDAGGVILLDPRIQATHLKSWSLLSMIRTDLLDRGIPWTRLLLERRGRSRPTLAADRGELFRIAFAMLAVAALLVWLLGGPPETRLVFFAVAGAFLGACLPMLVWFARQGGLLLGIAAVPLLTVYYLVSFVAGVAGVCLSIGHRIFGAD